MTYVLGSWNQISWGQQAHVDYISEMHNRRVYNSNTGSTYATASPAHRLARLPPRACFRPNGREHAPSPTRTGQCVRTMYDLASARSRSRWDSSGSSTAPSSSSRSCSGPASPRQIVDPAGAGQPQLGRRARPLGRESHRGAPRRMGRAVRDHPGARSQHGAADRAGRSGARRRLPPVACNLRRRIVPRRRRRLRGPAGATRDRRRPRWPAARFDRTSQRRGDWTASRKVVSQRAARRAAARAPQARRHSQ
jgi:hypothetical protein